MRFELGAYALNPDIRIIAPWREWDLHSREQLLTYAAEHGIPIERTSSNASPYSMDANLLHISFEGNELEVPATEPDEGMWRWTRSPEDAPDTPRYVELAYRRGDAVAIDGEALGPAAVIERLNAIGGEHGIGRTDIVENRYVGMKSRGCYETPGGTILLRAHRAIESITLDREAAHLKDELMPRYAHIIYNGYWWSPERLMLQALIDESQRHVNGTVRLKLYKGNVLVVGRSSDSDDLFDPAIATFEDDRGAYDQKDAEGFIRLNALRLRTAARRGRGVRESWRGIVGIEEPELAPVPDWQRIGRIAEAVGDHRSIMESLAGALDRGKRRREQGQGRARGDDEASRVTSSTQPFAQRRAWSRPLRWGRMNAVRAGLYPRPCSENAGSSERSHRALRSGFLSR